MLNVIEEDPAILDNIVWTDEASLKLSGYVNRHNCVYWYSEKKHLIIEQKLNQHGVDVWGGISSFGLIVPIFFDGNSDRQKLSQNYKKSTCITIAITTLFKRAFHPTRPGPFTLLKRSPMVS